MDNSRYKSMYEGLREEYDRLYNAFKEAEKLNGELTEENNKLYEKLDEKLNGISNVQEDLSEKVRYLTDEIDDRDHLLEAYRAVIRDVMNQ